MSLLRLLTAGKSLVGLKDTGNHYSVASPAALPKFASKKNPFRTSTRPETRQLPSQELPPVPNLTKQNGANSGDCDNSSPVSPITPPVEGVPSQTESGSTFEPKQPVADKARTKSPSRWTALLPWMRPKTEDQAIPRFEKTMVQGELSLDAA